jgi:hypothetical protein
MTTLERMRRYGGALIFGVVAAFLVASLVAKFWPGAKNTVFIALVIFWLMGLVQIVVRDIRSRDAAAFANTEKWCTEELPQEFRFITRDTTLEELAATLGPYRPVADTGNVRYDLPSGGAIVVFPEQLFSSDSKVRGVQFYSREDDVPVFPS